MFVNVIVYYYVMIGLRARRFALVVMRFWPRCFLHCLQNRNPQNIEMAATIHGVMRPYKTILRFIETTEEMIDKSLGSIPVARIV